MSDSDGDGGAAGPYGRQFAPTKKPGRAAPGEIRPTRIEQRGISPKAPKKSSKIRPSCRSGLDVTIVWLLDPSASPERAGARPPKPAAGGDDTSPHRHCNRQSAAAWRQPDEVQHGTHPATTASRGTRPVPHHAPPLHLIPWLRRAERAVDKLPDPVFIFF